MKLYRHPQTGEVFAYGSPQERQQWGDAALIAMTEAEVAVHLAPSAETLRARFLSSVQQRLDAFAQTRGYDGIVALCSYAASSVPRFAAEAQCGIERRDATWLSAFGILSEVQSGMRPMPSTLADVEPILPPMVWAANIPPLPAASPGISLAASLEIKQP